MDSRDSRGRGAAAGYGSHVTWWQTALRGADRRELPLVAALAALLVADGLYRAEGEFTLAADS